MATRPRLPRLLLAALAVAAALASTVAACRILRHRSSAPEPVGTRVQHERNLFTDLYGARTRRGVILFDAGVDPEGGALDRLVAALGATRADVRDVFLSHGHFDHVAASRLCTRARIRVGAADAAFMAHRAPTIAPVAGRLLERIFPAPAIEATDPLTGRVELGSGDDRVLAIPTPGHTPGSYVFVFDATLFAGDSITIDDDELGFAMAPFSVDSEANHRSIAALADALAGVVVHTVCTGHQGCTPEGRGAGMLARLLERANSGAK